MLVKVEWRELVINEKNDDELDFNDIRDFLFKIIAGNNNYEILLFNVYNRNLYYSCQKQIQLSFAQFNNFEELPISKIITIISMCFLIKINIINSKWYDFLCFKHFSWYIF